MAAINKWFLERKKQEYNALKADIEARRIGVGDDVVLGNAPWTRFPSKVKIRQRKTLITGTARFAAFHLAKLCLVEEFRIQSYDGLL